MQQNVGIQDEDLFHGVPFKILKSADDFMRSINGPLSEDSLICSIHARNMTNASRQRVV